MIALFRYVGGLISKLKSSAKNRKTLEFLFYNAKCEMTRQQTEKNVKERLKYKKHRKIDLLKDIRKLASKGDYGRKDRGIYTKERL